MKRIDLNEWKQIGAGGNGKTYIPKDGSHKAILKVCNGKGNTLESVRLEFESAMECFKSGIPTPEPFEIVRVGKGYGTLSQFIKNKRSLCRVCADNPERIGEMAALMAAKGNELHSEEYTGTLFQPASFHIRRGLEIFHPFLTRNEIAVIEQWINSLTDSRTLLHGDFNPGNLIVSDSGTYWIDTGRMFYGDPLIDIAHLYYFAAVMSRIVIVQHLSHMSRIQLVTFWREFLKSMGIESESDVSAYEAGLKKYVVLDIILRHSFKPSRLLVFLLSFQVRKIIKTQLH